MKKSHESKYKLNIYNNFLFQEKLRNSELFTPFAYVYEISSILK